MSIDLSIIIPVYNVEKYIARCLDSIFNQKIDESCFEVIVVNDGTPDNSMQIVDSYVAKHRNLIVINQENQGLSVARNVGLAKAVGDYVWFVDSDDWLTDKSLSIVLSYVNKGFNLYSSQLIRIWEDGKILKRSFPENVSCVSRIQYIKKFPAGAIQRFIIKRSLLADNGLLFYKGIYHEDAEFAPRLVFYAQTICLIREHIYYYAQRENSIMTSWKMKNTQDYFFVSQRCFDFAKAIDDCEYKVCCKVFGLKVLLRAFPYNKIRTMPNVKNFFKKKYFHIMIIAMNILLTRKTSFHEKVFAGITFMSPLLASYLLGKKYSYSEK